MEKSKKARADTLLDRNEAAVILDCHPATVNRLANKGTLPYVTKGYRGRRKRFLKSEVERVRDEYLAEFKPHAVVA